MKFSLLSVLVAAVFLFGVAAAAAVVDVEVTTWDETSDDGPGRPPRRTLFSKKNPTAAAVAAPPPPPELLFLQAGTDCALTPSATSGEYLFRATVGTVTTYFSERPDRLAGTMTTEVFAEQFADNFFVTSNPNVAITFSGDNSNTGPLIVVLSRPRMVDSSSSIIEYTMTQSDSQGEVASIDQFMGMSGSCSIFIDANYNTCIVASGSYSGTSKYSSNNPYGNNNPSNGNPYETCFSKKNANFNDPGDFCWSHSYLDWAGNWKPCTPVGFGSVWEYLTVVYGVVGQIGGQGETLCGQPCNEFSSGKDAAANTAATAAVEVAEGLRK